MFKSVSYMSISNIINFFIYIFLYLTNFFIFSQIVVIISISSWWLSNEISCLLSLSSNCSQCGSSKSCVWWNRSIKATVCITSTIEWTNAEITSVTSWSTFKLQTGVNKILLHDTLYLTMQYISWNFIITVIENKLLLLW